MRTDLVALGRSPGRTAKQVAAQCAKAEGGVLLIDDFHRLMPVGDPGHGLALVDLSAQTEPLLVIEATASFYLSAQPGTFLPMKPPNTAPK